jgi:hypothetical protein
MYEVGKNTIGIVKIEMTRKFAITHGFSGMNIEKSQI